MPYRGADLISIQEENKDIEEYPFSENDKKEDNEEKEMNKDIKSKIFMKTRPDIDHKTEKISSGEDLKINENLLKFIEDIVTKNLRRNTVRNSNTRANDQNLKILEAKNKISIKPKNIKKKTKERLSKVATKSTPINKITSPKELKRIAKNWIYVK